tara:strand:+ start:1468 stop:3372 length:1905 start_codon:yes stop_codon:yes gene_type:complete
MASILYADMLFPENDRYLKTVYVLFEWEQEPDAIGYNIQISDDSSFDNVLLDTYEYHTLYIDKNTLDWDNTFYWRVRPLYINNTYGNWIGESMFSIYPSVLQDFEISTYDEDSLQDGLIIFGQFAPDLLVGVIDRFGNEIWNSGSPDSDHQLGTLLNYVSKSGQLFGKKGQQGIKFNYQNDILWYSPFGTNIDLHEVQQLPNGNYMSFIPEFELGPIAEGWWTSFFQGLGYVADGETIEYPWLGQKIVEWDKNTGEEVWSWNAFDYFDMNQHDKDDELWWNAYVAGRFDWLHCNSFFFDEDESAMYISVRHLNQITKISYPSGEILYNIGLSDEFDTGSEDNICNDLRFSWQHHVQSLGNGELLFFDNGNLSETLLGDEYPTSRVRRIQVNDDYTCETLWQYELPEHLFGPGTGSVQLLDNGNYSVYTLGGYDDCSILEITDNQDLIWQAEASDSTSSIYRAYKVPSLYPEAFSLIANNYTFSDGGFFNYIDLTTPSLTFDITNKSGYTNTYICRLTNPEGDWFDTIVSEIVIDPYQTETISFMPHHQDQSTEVILTIYPKFHEYAVKELEFIVVDNDLLGDLNSDELLNIEDILLMINMVLDLIDNQDIGDMNADGGINILDIAILVDIILTN